MFCNYYWSCYIFLLEIFKIKMAEAIESSDCDLQSLFFLREHLGGVGETRTAEVMRQVDRRVC